MSSSVAKCVVAPSASSSILDGTPCAPTGSDQRARATVVPIGLVRISWPLEASPLSSNWPLTARAGRPGAASVRTASLPAYTWPGSGGGWLTQAWSASASTTPAPRIASLTERPSAGTSSS